MIETFVIIVVSIVVGMLAGVLGVVIGMMLFVQIDKYRRTHANVFERHTDDIPEEAGEEAGGDDEMAMDK